MTQLASLARASPLPVQEPAAQPHLPLADDLRSRLEYH